MRQNKDKFVWRRSGDEFIRRGTILSASEATSRQEFQCEFEEGLGSQTRSTGSETWSRKETMKPLKKPVTVTLMSQMSREK